ncbi:MAG: 4Fe-4S dicluster domain-containing protein, partial [Betaproteobacteria bacterium]|nr:4Fe-4S dicluster domain-containing protein [Betaproteobacteria bacterium]
MKHPIEFELNGLAVQAQAWETLWEVAQRQGVDIPHLCHKPGYRPDGNCRACVVEVQGERTLAASCCRAPQAGMVVRTHSERAMQSRALVMELLLADRPDTGAQWVNSDARLPHGELSQWADQMGVTVRPALQALRDEASTDKPGVAWCDDTHPAMAVDLSACIQCDRCVRACGEVQVNQVIGVQGRGQASRIVFDLADPMGESSCVACGECVQACPTGALSPKSQVGDQAVDRQVNSVCPFCGVGCLLTYHVKDERIVKVQGRGGPANEDRLCVKGRFGFDYAHHPDRLTTPLVRKAGVPKTLDLNRDPSQWADQMGVTVRPALQALR